MRRTNLIVLMVAILMGGGAAYMARNLIVAQNVQTALPQGTMVVASTPLAFGTALTSENTAEISWSAGRLPEGAYATKDELLKDGKRAVLSSVGRDEPILRSKITGPGQRASLSALLDEGKRAVTVRVDDVRGVAGFVLPGDRVDVVLIRTLPRPSGPPESISDVLLQHVKVLAVDQLLNERQEAPTIAKAVTLEVETDQAQKVLLATNIGKLSLILRQAGEQQASTVRRVTEGDLGVAEYRPAVIPVKQAEPMAAAVPPRDPSVVVEVVRGTRSEKYNVSRSIE